MGNPETKRKCKEARLWKPERVPLANLLRRVAMAMDLEMRRGECRYLSWELVNEVMRIACHSDERGFKLIREGKEHLYEP